MRIGSFSSMLGPLDDAAHQLTNNVCPLFVFKGPHQPHLIGTGIPAQIGRTAAVLTAAHVLAELATASVLTLGSGRALVLRGERRGFGHDPGRQVDVDLAAIILSAEERAQMGRYTFNYSLDFAEVGSLDEVVFYAIVGYPHSQNKLSPQLQKGTVVAKYFISRAQLPLSSVPSPDKFPHVHFAIGARTKGAIDVNGRRTGFPSPPGMSGGGVWRLSLSRDARKIPTARLVGIGIEYCKKPGAFLCTRIEHALPMFDDFS